MKLRGQEGLNWRWPMVGIAAVAAVFLAWYFWPQAKKTKGPPTNPTAVEAIPVTRGDVIEPLALSAQIEAIQGVTLQAEVAGKVSRIAFTEGTEVKQGQVLIELDPRIAEASLKETEADALLTQATLQRLEEAARAGAVSPLELDEARARNALAQANRASAAATLDKLVIRAPFKGRVGLRQVTLGQTVTAGQPLLNVVDDSRLRVRFYMPEKALAQAVVGLPIEIRAEGQSFTTSITAIDSLIDPTTRTRAAQVVLAAQDLENLNLNPGLSPGQFAEVVLPLTLASNAVIVPAMALLPSLEGQRVMVVSGSSPRIGMVTQAFAQPVTVLARASETVAIEGLNEGQWVIVAGQQKLRGEAPAIKLVTPTLVPFMPSRPEEFR